MTRLELINPQAIADRARRKGAGQHTPGLFESVIRARIGFMFVSVAGFAPWALAGRALHEAVGEVELYAALSFHEPAIGSAAINWTRRGFG